LVNQQKISNLISLNQHQEKTFVNLINELVLYNKHTNLVGRSTLFDPWKSHILDCIQIAPLIKNKKSTILDMGTGAGFPGLVLAIAGFNKVTLVDSNGKKIKFLEHVSKKLDIKVDIFSTRIEEMKKKHYDFLISRALANLNKLLTYSHKFLHNNTVLIFLKGENVNDEIKEAKKYWSFNIKIYPSYSDERGKILFIRNLSFIK
tara:strand:- start:917 stop:1528 length:612 start_codon:yes stop_codon:yes gene_type:complete